MKPVIEKTINRLFGNRSEAAAEALINSAPVQNLLAEIDGADVARRTALWKEMQTLPKRHEASCIAANAEVERAREAQRAAEKVLTQAIQAVSNATVTAYALSHAFSSDAGRLERELETTCDPRIYTFLERCYRLQNIARNLPFGFVEVRVVDGFGGGRDRMMPDCSRGTAAFNAVQDAITAARELRMLPLSAAEVTTKLRAIAKTMEEPFRVAGGSELTIPEIEDTAPAGTMH